MEYTEIVEKVSRTLIRAGSSFTDDKSNAYKSFIEKENNEHAKWVLETILENSVVAEKNSSPLCDDSGIPHLILEVGKNRTVTGEFLNALYEGVRKGLNTLPGRPMAVVGDDIHRLEQSEGLYPNSDALEPAPLMIKYVEDYPDRLKLTVMMQGGGPEIRAKTYRVFHRHKIENIKNEIIEWAKESIFQLGCTPCTLAVGIGRSHYEATSMMLQAMADGDYAIQSDLEKEITDNLNKTEVGPLGLGGKSSVLATFLKVGPQRASGVRIVAIRPCCCFEPRKASVLF